MPLILSAYCPLTAHWGVSPGSRQTEKYIIVWSLDAVSIFTFIFHLCIFRKQLLVSLVSDYSVWDFRGRPARSDAYWKKTHLSSNKQTVWFMKPVTIHGVRFRLCTKLKDLLSHMGREDHVPFIHLAVVMLSLCSYPLSHVILMMYPSSYQPSEAFVYFALATVGGMQAFSSERKKKQQKNCYHFDHVVRGLLMFGPLIIREHPDKIAKKIYTIIFSRNTSRYCPKLLMRTEFGCTRMNLTKPALITWEKLKLSIMPESAVLFIPNIQRDEIT